MDLRARLRACANASSLHVNTPRGKRSVPRSLPAPSWKFERRAVASGYQLIAGVDEAGRGALFGPVYAAAVILSEDRTIRGLQDSKQLTAERREILAGRIRERAVAWAVGAADAHEIDRINILEASRLAMKRAIDKLQPAPGYLLVDFVRVDTSISQLGIVRGDALSRSIAAASILAKVERDACLARWHQVFPAYCLDSNKGYCAPRHMAALREFGPTAMHRFSFLPVRNACPVSVWPGYAVGPTNAGPVQAELFDGRSSG